MGDGPLVGRGKLAKLGNGGGNDLYGEVNVGLRGMAAKAETQAGARFFRGQADGGEHVRRLDGARRTSRTCRASETLEVESDEQRFAFNTGKNKIGRVGSAGSASAIDAGMGSAVHQAVLELVTECAEALRIVGERVAGDLGGFAESDDAGNVFRAGTNAALVVAAVKQRPQACSAANVKRADALRPVQFVAGKRKQIELELVHINCYRKNHTGKSTS